MTDQPKPVSELLRTGSTGYWPNSEYHHHRFPDAVALLERIVADWDKWAAIVIEFRETPEPDDAIEAARAYLAALRHEVAGNGQEIES